MGQSESTPAVGDGLYMNVERHKWPIIYSSNYDISFFKLESIHPFDSSKWRKVFEFLKEEGLFKGSQDTIQPLEASEDDLLLVHTKEYLDSLKVSLFKKHQWGKGLIGRVIGTKIYRMIY